MPENEGGAAEGMAELLARLGRLEADLDVQRAEMATLRAQMQLMETKRSAGQVASARPPAYGNATVAEFPAAGEWPGFPQPKVPETAAEVPAGFPPRVPMVLPVAAQPSVAPQATAVPSFASLEKNAPERSLENRIGSQWFARVGVLALLIGVAWFLKLAYDNHWIHTTPIGRIAVGLVAGAGVVLWSERFRRKGYAAFSYALKAVGSGTLYLALWASFHLYHLLPAEAAMGMMIAVTVWNAWMAWSQDAELLAVYALAGGYATPLLVSSGENHEIFLFTYVLAMAAAVLLLVAKKPWQRLLLGSFPATVAYFIGWYVTYWNANEFAVTAGFAVLLGAPFAAAGLIGRQREGMLEGVLAPLAASTFVGCALYSVLEDSGRHIWLPWAAVAMGAVYLLLAQARRSSVAAAMHLAIAVVLLTLAIPLKATGHWLVVGWVAEGVALLWVASRALGEESQPRVRLLMRWLGVGALALGVADTWLYCIGLGAEQAFVNERFATEAFAVAALAAAAWLARHPVVEKDERELSWPAIAVLATLAANVIAPLAVVREIAAYWGRYHGLYDGQRAGLSEAAFLMLYATGMIAWSMAARDGEPNSGTRKMLRAIGLVYLGFGFLTMLAAPLFGTGPDRAFVNLRLVLEAAGMVCLAMTAMMLWRKREQAAQWATIAAVLMLAFDVLALAAGVHEIVTYFGAGAAVDAGLAESVAISGWLMVYAAALLVAGFWKRMAFVRWQGLVLLVFTIGKVFLYDMRNLSSVYRVLSFMGLGVVLMAVSFAYQKDWLKLREGEEAEKSEAEAGAPAAEEVQL